MWLHIHIASVAPSRHALVWEHLSFLGHTANIGTLKLAGDAKDVKLQEITQDQLIYMFAVHQTVLSFVSELASNLRYTKGNIALRSPQSTSRGFGDSNRIPVSQTPQTAFQSFPKDDQLIKVGPEYVQTSGEPFVYYHKAFCKKTCWEGHEGWQHVHILIHQ